jgi:hypothetical protein
VDTRGRAGWPRLVDAMLFVELQVDVDHRFVLSSVLAFPFQNGQDQEGYLSQRTS